MKNVLLFACLFAALQLRAQKNSVCYVTSVYGSVQKTNGQKLTVGDTLMRSELETLQPSSGWNITVYNDSEGSIQCPSKEQGPGWFEMLLDVFKSKSSRVNLSSRGSCSSEIFDDCIKTDSLINPRLLLIDSLTLPQPYIDNETPKAFFVQWKYNGKLVNKILACNSGDICIKPSDICNAGEYPNENTNILTLGAIINAEGNKTYNKLGTMQVYCTTTSFINDYYTGLQAAMKDKTSKEIFNRLYTELYVFYGKPDICILKKIIHYTE